MNDIVTHQIIKRKKERQGTRPGVKKAGVKRKLKDACSLEENLTNLEVK